MIVLVDGDIVCYRCGFAAESTRYSLVDSESGVPIGQFDSAAAYKEFVKETEIENFEVEKERLVEPLSHALANVKSVMSRIVDATNATHAHVFLSKGQCFRHGLATIKEYKGHRKDMVKPVHYDDIRAYLTKHYGAITYEAIEADDALALCQNDRTVIASIDKDLLQVPGRHYNWVKEEKVLITPDVGLKRLYQQVLSGDSTDNIPGIRGIGEVKARRILKEVPADKALLSQACTAEWEKYLLKEIDGFERDEETGNFWYTPWCGDGDSQLLHSPAEIAAEVFQLVKVGGKYAEEALEEAGEELPDTNTT